ncbi:MAG: hypothetical protein GY772_14435 [bacterium]|nr:hypothetical protein [bacterium]
MPEGLGIEALDRTPHGHSGVVRVGAVEDTVQDDPAVQVHDGTVRRALPAANQRSRAAFEAFHDPVRDGEEVLRIDCDRLARRRRVVAPHLDEALRRLACRAAPGSDPERSCRHEQGTQTSSPGAHAQGRRRARRALTRKGVDERDGRSRARA